MKTLKCIEKEVRLTHRHGKGRRGNVSVIREHYLRDDISCKVENCSIAICKQQGNKLNPEGQYTFQFTFVSRNIPPEAQSSPI